MGYQRTDGNSQQRQEDSSVTREQNEHNQQEQLYVDKEIVQQSHPYLITITVSYEVYATDKPQ